MVDPTLNTAAAAWAETLDAATAAPGVSASAILPGDLAIAATITSDGGAAAAAGPGGSASASAGAGGGLDVESLIKVLVVLGVGAAVIGALFSGRGR